MVVRHLGRLGATRIDHYQRTIRVSRDVAQNGTRALEAMRLPWVLADEHGDLGLLVAAAEAGPEEFVVDPELAGLFLGERVGAENRAERAPGRGAVASAKMIPLPAAAVIEDARAAELLANFKEAGSDLADRGIPVDFLEVAVGSPPHRRSQPVPAILVVVNPLRLLAGVALRRDML